MPVDSATAANTLSSLGGGQIAALRRRPALAGRAVHQYRQCYHLPHGMPCCLTDNGTAACHYGERLVTNKRGGGCVLLLTRVLIDSSLYVCCHCVCACSLVSRWMPGFFSGYCFAVPLCMFRPCLEFNPSHQALPTMPAHALMHPAAFYPLAHRALAVCNMSSQL